MAKLYGKELDDELAKRKQAREKRLEKGLTLRMAARTNDMGLTPSEYCDWETGADVCPHEKHKPTIGGVHPPFILFDKCEKCGHIQNARKATDDIEGAWMAVQSLKNN